MNSALEESTSDIVLFFSSQAIKDLHLLVIVAGLLAVDVVFLSCWIVIDPLEAEILTFKEMVSPLRTATLTDLTICKFACCNYTAKGEALLFVTCNFFRRSNILSH